MFSLIITIVSIALVAALALATIYFGGDAYKSASSRAAAATLVNQSLQLDAAGTLASANGTGWPQLAPIFTQPYLSEMPIPPANAYVSGIAPAKTDWEYYLADRSTNHFVLRNKINREVCFAINRISGFEGIPATWDGVTVSQCFGTGQTVEGAYTYFYAPSGSLATHSAAALAQSLVQGNSVVPGYPRLCATGSSIQTGLCSPGRNVIPGAPPEMDLDTAIASAMDGMGEGYPDAPEEDHCLANPTLPECDVSRYQAVRVRFLLARPYVRFVAIKDCSTAVANDFLCIPNLNSQVRVWRWSAPPNAAQNGGVSGTDGRLAFTSFSAEGFTIGDGVNVWTASRRSDSATTYSYIDIREYPTVLSSTRAPALAVDCQALQADIARRGGQFLSDPSCTTIETGHSYGWNFIYSEAAESRPAALHQANPTWTNANTWGDIDSSDMGWNHFTLHSPTGIGGHPLYVGVIEEQSSTSNGAWRVVPGASGGWPVAPLVTTVTHVNDL
jgi:hypothetical protein